MPLVLPFTTFGDLEKQGLEIRVHCSRCGRETLVDATDPKIRGREIVGQRYRCQSVLWNGPCTGVGLPSIEKAGSWTRRAAEHSRQMAAASRPRR